ncbi:MAG: YdcF family protein [Chitinophagaceae bacterium]|nr:YdcF family protein [Chitinophagaceae bacterium]
MFFLSKLVYFFLSPFVWVCIILLFAIFSRNAAKSRRLLIIACITLFIFSNNVIESAIQRMYQYPEVQLKDSSHYSCGILLTGMVGVDKNNKGHFGGASDRYIQTLLLYKRGIIDKILITGGSGLITNQTFREADFLQEKFITAGVAAEDIIIENNSRNTYENALFTKRLLDSIRIRAPFVLITSSLHMPRSLILFRHMNVPVVPYPCDFITVAENITPDEIFIPSAWAMLKWQSMIKEWVGILFYKIKL